MLCICRACDHCATFQDQDRDGAGAVDAAGPDIGTLRTRRKQVAGR